MYELIAGQEYLVIFVIDGQSVLVKTHFTGEYTTVNDEKVYFLKHDTSGKEYAFTEKQLKSFVGANDTANRGNVDSISL